MMRSSSRSEIGFRKWLATEARAVFLLVHGLGAHTGRWEAMADFFLKRGVSSYAIELSPDGFGNYHDKILRLYDIAKKDNPAKKIFLIGESMGAVIALLVCAAAPGLFNGVVCISPAFRGRYRMTALEYIKVFTPLLYDPGKQFAVPFDTSMCTRDIEYRNRMDRDPREYRSVSSRMIFDILLAQARAMAVKKKMLTPALFLLAENDLIVDPQSSRAVFAGLAVKDKTLIGFPGMYHSLSIDLGKEKVFEEILKWMGERI